jgi:Ca-activated chloride channel homolog
MRVTILSLIALISTPAWADSKPAGRESASTLVRQANELLLGDKPAEALRTYEQAQSLKPDAREIDFDQALAHYRLGELDKAREAFTRAAGGAGDKLADDALYGLGTCDHAEALTAEDPKQAVPKIENAMRQYQNVLANQPDHAAARDANRKAASYWRQLKQQMQQQQEQQNQDQNEQKQNEEQNQDQQSKQEQQQSQQNKQEQQQESQAQQDQQKEQEKKEQEKEQEQKASAQKEQREKQEPSAEEKEEASRDQAERKLREMVQAMRDRKKHRREEVKTPTYRPTEKDW